MKFTKYIKDKINYILGFITYCIIIIGYMKAMKIDNNAIIIIVTISFIFSIIALISNYLSKNKYLKEINKIMDGLDEKYLISEVIKKPTREENLAHYKILKRANKSMLENVSNVKAMQKDYKEYIESWVHEIKIPITSSKLLCENNKSEITNKIDEEIEEINNYVEQALFYARLDKVSNDFIIKQISLSDVVKNVLARNKKIMIQNDIKVELKNLSVNAYSIQLKLRDNGMGIKKSEIDRIFDKGFTGTNGRNQKKSTGIGLYLCKKMCEELGMRIQAESKENEYTEMIITIPKNKKMIR